MLRRRKQKNYKNWFPSDGPLSGALPAVDEAGGGSLDGRHVFHIPCRRRCAAAPVVYIMCDDVIIKATAEQM